MNSTTLKLRRTGKIALLLCALTLISVSALNGMEPEKPNYMAMLPQEVKNLIVLTLTQSSTIEEATNAIRSLTETNKEFNALINDPKTTRTIISLLAKKFNAPSAYIALQLNIPGSEQYITLSLSLMTALLEQRFEDAENFIKLGAGVLNGMEQNPYEMLPLELKQQIINTALTTSKSVDDAVNTIQRFGILHGVYYDTAAAINLLIKTLPNDLDKAIEMVKPLQGTTLQDFTKLTHVLADKFNLSTLSVTAKFETPIAKQYQKLHFYLFNQSRYGNVNKMVELIQQGADINGTQTFHEEIRTPLYYAISGDKTEIVKFLVKSGVTQKYLPKDFQEKLQNMLAKSNEK